MALTADGRSARAAQARAQLGALLVAEIAAVAVLHGPARDLAIDWAAPGRWLLTTAPPEVLMVALRYAGLALGWWLLASTGAYLLLRAARLPRLAHGTARLTLPAVRRCVDRALAAGAAATLIAAAPVTALAAERSPPDTAVLRVPEAVVAEVEAGEAGPVMAPESAVAEVGVPGVHVVRAGEHLWAIAAAIAAEPGHARAGVVDEAVVAPYWRRLVAANRGQLRSGDPDVIYPGERIVLPPWDEG
jgi:hypothetical protein